MGGLRGEEWKESRGLEEAGPGNGRQPCLSNDTGRRGGEEES